MRVLLVSATPFEIAPTLLYLESECQKEATFLLALCKAHLVAILKALAISNKLIINLGNKFGAY